MRILGVSICFLLVAFLFTRGAHLQSSKLSEDVLRMSVPGDEVKELTTTDAFYSSLGRTGVPGGLVDLRSCGQRDQKHTWSPKNSELRQVLDALVTTDKRYRWTTDEGVLNLLPVAGEPSILQTRINKFHVQDAASASAALDRLLALPEIKEAMRKLHLQQGITLVLESSLPHPKPFSVFIETATLRQALNAIARAQGHGIWQYLETQCRRRKELVIRF
jgi:hypothetical protein